MPRDDSLEKLKQALPQEWQEVPVLSYSQLTTADRCGFKWYAKYPMKYKSKKKNPPMDRGSFVHRFLLDLYSCIMQGMTPVEWSEHRLNVMLYDIMDNLDFEDQIQSVSVAMQTVRRFCQGDVLHGLTPVAAEQHYLMPVTTHSGRRFLLQGYVDLVGIDHQQRVWIVEHKAPAELWSPFRAKMSVQLPIYEVLLRADGMRVYGGVINQLRADPKIKHVDKQEQDKMYSWDWLVWTEGQLTAIWNEFVAMAEYLLDLMEGKRPVRRSLQDHDCYRCEVAGPCHANLSGEPLEQALIGYEGTQMALRGMPAGTGVTIHMD